MICDLNQSFQIHRQLMREVNEEFRLNAKIKGLVSYIYYPAQRGGAPMGHAELEIEGNSWTLFCKNSFRPLECMVWVSRFRLFPFFRFPMTVTPQELKTLRDYVPQMTPSISCSYSVSKCLSKSIGYNIPFPCSLFPLPSAIYLKAAKMLGSKKIEKIELYGNHDRIGQSVINCLPAVLSEIFVVSSLIALLFMSIYAIV